MFSDKPILPPPWIKYPQIDRGSMEWRMGPGDAYVSRWSAWGQALTQEQRDQYMRLFPEPAVWRGAITKDKPLPDYCRGGLCIERWQEDGQLKYTREQLKSGVVSLGRDNAVLFWGHHPSRDGRITASCLSQWFMSPFRVYDTQYCCMEQFMMASKARLFEDRETLEHILKSTDPKDIKALGRQVKGFDDAVWNEAKHLIVLCGNYRKFTQDPALRDYLLLTGDSVLVEASPYDRVSGIGLCADDPRAQNPDEWQGENLLGFALMEVRDDIRSAYQNLHLCSEQPEFF